MKIAMYAGYYYPHIGGYCKNIHELSRRLVARGHIVDVITCNTEPQVRWHETRDGVQIIRIPLLWHVGGVMPLPIPSPELLIALRKNDYDVIVTQTRIFPTTAIGALHSLFHGTLLVHVERGSRHTVLGSKILSKLAEIYDHTIGKAIVAQADRVIGISETAAAFTRHMHSRATPLTIHNGIEIPKMAERTVKDDLTIVFTGRVIYAKGVQDLIQAFDALAPKYPRVKLLIVGDGVYLDSLKHQVSRLVADAAARITFAGGVDQKEINGILSTCDIFVNPSYSEGLPTTVMEAASLGMPIVATDVGGTNEVVVDHVSGLLVKPHHTDSLTRALKWMLDYPSEAAALGREARNIMQSFDWDGITDQWEELLVSLGKERASRGEKRTSSAATRYSDSRNIS